MKLLSNIFTKKKNVPYLLSEVFC